MPSSKTLSEIIRSGVCLEVNEAIAIVQQLIASGIGLPDPASLDNVLVSNDGAVTCPTYGVPPNVLGMGMLLQTLLPPDGKTRVPGALRYTIARALLKVNAPPFGSVLQLSDALRRYEKTTDRKVVLQQLYARAQSATPPTITRSFVERRRLAAPTADLRRHLREADEHRYLLLAERTAATSVAAIVPANVRPIEEAATLERQARASGDDERRPWRRSVAGAVAVLISFGLGYASVARLSHVARPQDGPNRPEIVSRGAFSPPPCEPEAIRILQTQRPLSSNASGIADGH